MALDLESLADYRPQGCIQIFIRNGAPKSGVAPIMGSSQPIRPQIDADGDLSMRGTSVLLAAIQILIIGDSSLREESAGAGVTNLEDKLEIVAGVTGGKELPRALWRAAQDIDRMMEEGGISPRDVRDSRGREHLEIR